MATYTTIHTSYGLQRLEQAEALGIPINITHMAVGDGGGAPIDPDESMTSLVGEKWRSTVNTVEVDQANPTQYYVELDIPANIGGWTIREFGLFDDQGGMVAVGSFPDTYKTVPTDGATSDLVIRAELIVSNAGVINIVIDPNVAIASRQWVQNTITLPYLLPGGTTQQILRKKSNLDGDVEWADPTDANVTVDVMEDKITLADGQRTIALSNTTTRGLAVYVEGMRIGRGPGEKEWLPDDIDPDTTIVLGQSYPEGTTVLATQNEPTASTPTPLERSKNLADVEDKSTARANLNVYSRAETDQKAPPGLIAFFARNTAPPGWLKANGAVVGRATYPELFSAIGTMFNLGGEDSNSFRLPDIRGEFIRAWDDGRGVDLGRAFGSWQGHMLAAHAHSYGNPVVVQSGSGAGAITGAVNTASTTAVTGGAETRPRNVAFLACIKY